MSEPIVEIEESRLIFRFDSTWRTVEQWDRCSTGKRLTEALQGSDALDIVAEGPSAVMLLEVKNYRNPDQTPNLFGEELAMKVATKVRDTVAGLCGAPRMAGEGRDSSLTKWQRLADAIADPKRPLYVVFWWEPGAYARTEAAAKQQASQLTQLLKARLRWLTTRVFVYSVATGSGFGFRVSHAAGKAGGPRSTRRSKKSPQHKSR